MSLVFLMWFLSGFVMIFSGFPHPHMDRSFVKSEALNNYKSQIRLPTDSTQNLNQLTLEVVNSKALYTSKSKSFYSSNTKIINAISLEPIVMFPEHELDSMVVASYQSSIAKKRILTDYDTWIPWAHFKKFFPIHKYYLNDTEKTQVYVASTTGKVVQETTLKQRWFARFGAIPHWFYFKSLRLQIDLWRVLIIWISGLGSIMCLSGLFVGFYRVRKWRILKKKGLLKFSPYKEKYLRWHHVFGLIFGLFVFTFVFSGMCSMADVPQWLLPIDKSINYNKLWNENISNSTDFKLPLYRVLNDERFNSVKQIDFKQIDSIPYYVLYQTYRKPIFIKGINKDTVLKRTFLYRDLKKIAMKKFKGQSYKIEQLIASDNYYKLKGDIVAKILFDDANSTWVYINSENPTILHPINKSQRVSRWLYKGLHTFKLPKLEDMEWLRITLLIIVSLFGTVVSFSGVILGYRYLKKISK